MGATKDLFMLMREKEIVTSNFLPSKKEIKQFSEQFAKSIIDSGDVNLEEVYAQSLRLKEAITTIETTLKNSLPCENFESFGLKGVYKNGGDIPQFEEDPVYAEIKKQLKDREELLKTRLKTDVEIYDSDGIEVPKVSTKPRKSSLTITY